MPIQYSPEGQITGWRVDSVVDGKNCIKELKLKKKEFQLAKKEISANISKLRAEHRSENIRRGPAVRGSGVILGFARSMHQINKQSARINLDNAIRPLESKKIAIDQVIAKIDAAILQIEKIIIENS